MQSNGHACRSEDTARRSWPVNDTAECISIAAILNVFGFTFSQLCAFSDREVDPFTGEETVSADFRGVRSRLLLTVVSVPAEENNGRWTVRLVHSVNPFANQSTDPQSAPEYETTHLYLAGGCHTRLSRLRLNHDRELLATFARQSLTRQSGDDTFLEWQWTFWR